MIDYISVYIDDINRAKSFYAALFATLEYRRHDQHHDVISYGKESIDFVAMKTPSHGFHPARLRPSENKNQRHIHIAFSAASREQVDNFYRIALTLQAKSQHPPCPMSYPQGEVYSACIRDPFGHELEAVFNLGSV